MYFSFCKNVLFVFPIIDATRRIVASAKVEKFLGNRYPDLKPGQRVKALVVKRTDIGYRAIVDNAFAGMLFENELYTTPVIGRETEAWVKAVRPDGKIDLTLAGPETVRLEKLCSLIIDRLRLEPGGFIPLADSSSPESIRETFGCSKKDFKKSIGHLYRDRRIVITPGGISLS